jgi:hypothetical protein
MKNYYQILGVAPTASAEEVKEAYRKLSKRVHPDVNWGDKIFEELFKDINEAYKELSDEYRRADYNKKFQHFFFKQPVTEEFLQQQKIETKRFFRRKMIINGGISVILVCSVVTINAMVFADKTHAERNDKMMASVAPVDVSATVNELFFSKDESVRVSTVAFKTSASLETGSSVITSAVDEIKPGITEPLHKEVSPIEVSAAIDKEVEPLTKDNFLYSAIAIKETKPVKHVVKQPSSTVVAEVKPVVKTVSPKSVEKKPAVVTKTVSEKVAPVKQSPPRQWTETEMMSIAHLLNERREQSANKTLSVRLVKAANSNILNPFNLAKYIQQYNFPIAGRGVTARSFKGLRITQSAACVTVTIGNIK